MNKKISLILFMGTIFFLVFVNDLFSMWILMELNLFSFFSFMFSVNFKNEILIIYMLIQIFSSLLLLWYILTNQTYSDILFTLSFSLKLGLLPYSLWYMFLQNMNWFPLFLLLTLQKIFYLTLIFMQKFFKLFFFFILVSSFVTIFNLSQMNIKNIIIISSIFHTSWIFLGGTMNKFLSFFYFFLYVMSSIWVFNFILKISNVLLQNKMQEIDLILIILSISGIPPFLLFFPKLMVMMNLEIFILVMVLFLIFTLINITVYLRIMVWFFLTSKKSFKIFLKSKKISLLPLTLIFLFIF